MKIVHLDDKIDGTTWKKEKCDFAVKSDGTKFVWNPLWESSDDPGTISDKLTNSRSSQYLGWYGDPQLSTKYR
jgi:hypothetical protein